MARKCGVTIGYALFKLDNGVNWAPMVQGKGDHQYEVGGVLNKAQITLAKNEGKTFWSSSRIVGWTGFKPDAAAIESESQDWVVVDARGVEKQKSDSLHGKSDLTAGGNSGTVFWVPKDDGKAYATTMMANGYQTMVVDSILQNYNMHICTTADQTAADRADGRDPSEL